MKLINTSLIIPGNNDRKSFLENELKTLADSIAAHGLIQPITVRLLENGLYEIVAGERRFRAASLLQWESIPANIVSLSDEEASAVMLAENVARKDLDPIEEGRAYQSRINLYGWTVREMAEKAGVSAVRVHFRIKLLSLRQDIQDLIKSGNISLGYAQVLSDAGLDNNFQMIAIRQLRESKSPTPSWFRKVCSELQDRQNQIGLFELPILGGSIQTIIPPNVADPASPSTHQPPMIGDTPKSRIANQILFWSRSAIEWHKLGKPFKRQECDAAVKALQFALSAL